MRERAFNIPQRAVRRGKAHSSRRKGGRYWKWWRRFLKMQPKAPDSASAQTKRGIRGERRVRLKDTAGCETTSSLARSLEAHKLMWMTGNFLAFLQLRPMIAVSLCKLKKLRLNKDFFYVIVLRFANIMFAYCLSRKHMDSVRNVY